MTINLVNESKRVITQPDLSTAARILTGFAGLVDSKWDMGNDVVLASPVRLAGQWNLCIVDNFPNPKMQKTALGYHEVVNGEPIAYIRADAYGSRSIFGTYTAPFKLKNIQIHGERFVPGVITVIAHELAEMLIDPMVTRLSTPDGKNRQWVLEVCDHTVGLFHGTANGVNGVLPDFTTPSFYDDAHGTKPYSYLGVPPAPFTLVKGAYGYWKDSMGQLHQL